MNFSNELAGLFERDLDQLINNLEELDEEDLWEIPDGVTNSCGVLVQHLTGNLNHFIGASIGETGYERDREREFTDTGESKAGLIDTIRAVSDSISGIIRDLDQKELDRPYPGRIPYEGSTRKILMHLYGHLSYHMGQINYLRRILAEQQVEDVE